MSIIEMDLVFICCHCYTQIAIFGGFKRRKHSHTNTLMREYEQVILVYCKLRILAIMVNLPLEMSSVLNNSKLNMDYIDELMIDRVF